MKKFLVAITLFLIAALPALAQTVPLGPRFVLPYQTVVDGTGTPIPGALLYFYSSGTNIPLATYSNPLLTTPNSNPVQANAAGVFPAIFLSGNYKIVLTDASNNQIWAADPVYGVGPGAVTALTVTGLAITPPIGTTNQALVITQNSTGAATPTGPLLYSVINVTNTLSVTTPSGTTNGLRTARVDALHVNMFDSGSSPITSAATFQLVTTNAGGDKVAVIGWGYSNSTNNSGFLIGGDFGATCDASCTQNSIAAVQVEVANLSGSAVLTRMGLDVLNDPGSVVPGSTFDAAIAIEDLDSTGAGSWLNGIVFGRTGNAPLATTGNAIYAFQAQTIANFCNCANWTITGDIFDFANLVVTGAGNGTVTNNINGNVQWQVSNSSTGTAATAQFVVATAGSLNVEFGLASVNYTNALYAGRAYLSAVNTGLVIGSTTASPTIFIVGNAEVARIDGATAGQFDVGLSGTTAGAIKFSNATSGSITIKPPTGALGSAVLTLPDVTATLTALGNTVTGSGGTLVESTSPTLVTPVLGDATATSINFGGSTLSTYTSAGSWTPTDNSGASLSFTGVSASYSQIGNMVFAYGNFTYPSTASGASAAVAGLPVAFPNQHYAPQCFASYSTQGGALYVNGNVNSANFGFYNASGASLTNANMSGKTIIFECVYPAI